MKNTWLILSLIVLLFGVMGCETSQEEPTGKDITKETWLCAPGYGNFNYTITLENHPEGNKFYTSVENPSEKSISFGNGWIEYRIAKDTVLYDYDGSVDYRGDMIFFLEQWDSDLNLTWSNPNYKWFMQHTEDTLTLEFAGVRPGHGEQIYGYIFKRVR